MGIGPRPLEAMDLTIDPGFWKRNRVFITGHTGFKGTWLAMWLQELGATVAGYSIDIPTRPSMFESVGAADLIQHEAGDIRNLEQLRDSMRAFRPTVVFHLAAQALVRGSYDVPLDTFATNVMGTANVLDVCRTLDNLRAVVICTSDKCYRNDDRGSRFVETDPLGGRDPYSASKAAAEIVTTAYRESFFHPERHAAHGVGVASVRAGNVIGGGDWALDRIVPDAARAFSAGQPLILRRPEARRPWQFVLEPLSGYLMVARGLAEEGPRVSGAWNFGPPEESVLTVRELADRFRATWGPSAALHIDAAGSDRHEAHVLRLDSTHAERALGWRPRLSVEQALEYSAVWYQAYYSGATPADMRALTVKQIAQYAAASLATV